MDARIRPAAFLALLAFAFASATALLGSTAFGQPAVAPALSAVAQGDSKSDNTKSTTSVRVARLVKNLGSPSYAARQAANEELAELGPLAAEQITLAAKSNDPEVRTRARQLLHRIKVAEIWNASTVELGPSKLTIEEAAESLNLQTVNRLETGDQYANFRPASVTFPSGTMTFWSAVDELCRQSKNRFRPSFGSGPSHWVLIDSDGNTGNCPIAYAGPVRAQICSARRVFVEDFDFRKGETEVSHAIQFSIQLCWENRFRLMARRSQLDVAEAIDNVTGEPLLADVTTDDWCVFDGRHPRAKMSIRLRPPPVEATRLRTLSLRWPVLAVGDYATLETDGLEEEKTYTAEDARLTVERIRQRGNQWEATVAIRRDLVVPEPREILFKENDFEIVDDEGKTHPLRSSTKLGITDSTARMKLVFATDSPAGQAVKLRMRFPRIRDQRDLMITFRDVPLPRALPK